MILQDQRVFARVAEFDPVTNSIQWRKRMPSEPFKISGWIGEVGGHEMMIYKREGRLFLRLNRDEVPFEQLRAELEHNRERRRLKLYRTDILLSDIEYQKPVINPPINDVLSPGETEENHDFGLMVYNILSSSERQHVGLEVWV